MQRPSTGYRGGIRVGRHSTQNHHHHENGNARDDDDNISLSNSDEERKPCLSSGINNDFESAIRNLRPSAVQRKKVKANIKADSPPLNAINDENQQLDLNGEKDDDDDEEENNRHHRRWFPKADVGHVDSDDFIRHNHVESQQPSETIDQSTPPAFLTTIPPAGISARPTAVIGPARSISAFFSSNSSIKKGDGNSYTNLLKNSPLKSTKEERFSSPSAFQPIHSMHKNLPKHSTSKPAPVLMDIPQHKALERGQQLTKVHISHPQSPSIVHLMLHEDFNTACRLLHDMAAHAELQIDHAPTHPFKAQVNRLCACYHEGRWFRCRILQISPDFSSATVVYLDWGMMIPMQIGPESIRRLPNEFFSEPACSIMCHLDGVPDATDSMPSDAIDQCIALLSEDEYDVTVNGYDSTTGGQVVLSVNGRIINDQIRQSLVPNSSMSPEEELIEQFRHELPLTIGDDVKALLSSFSGKDDSFYVLLVNEHTLAIDQAMHQLQEMNHSNRYTSEIPRLKTLVVARYADDGKWYRAWIKSICLQRQQATVFFVDYGNESTIMFSDISPCPDSVRTLPWLGIRVRLTNETITHEELAAFWKMAESNYIWIRILEILKDSYGIQMKIDYTLLLRQERLKASLSNRLVHTGVQATLDERSVSTVCLANSSDINSHLMTPLFNDQSQIGNENFIRNLFELISKELRRLRHRINDSDETAQDRHNQIMQLLFSSFNLNNSNHPKKT